MAGKGEGEMAPSWKSTSETYKCSQNPSSFFSAKHVSDCQVVINVEDLAATDPDDSLEHGAFMKQQRLDLIKFTLFHEESDVGEVAPMMIVVTCLVHSSLHIQTS